MIIIDYSQVVISTLMSEVGSRSDVEIQIELLRHMIINTIRSHKVKFQREYGDVVIACDSKKYWRKQYFPYYKANRKKAREDSGFNWAAIFDAINTLKEELRTFFPYKVIEIEGAEADDVIACLVKWSAEHDLTDALFPEPKPLLIISGDHDFNQLQKYKHVKQFSPVQKKFIKPDSTPQRIILEHIIKGDKGDGIPNVLTSDDAIVQGERQRPVSSKKLEEWTSDPTSMPQDDNFKRNYQRNQTLVDFEFIPDHINQSIINSFVEYPIKDKSQILNYLIQHRMKQMIEHIEEL